MIFRTPRVKIEGSVESTQDQIILETSFPGIERFSQGKVRDVYRVGDHLLIVATDRISAFDFILPTGIPDKGRVLTQMSVFWFDFLRDVTATHFITADVDAYPPELRPFRAQLEGRSMLVKRAEMVPIECVARGYLAGSGWKEYRADGHGLRHPASQGAAREQPFAGADLHTGHQSADRATTRTFHSSAWRRSWESDVAAATTRSDAGDLSACGGLRRIARHHHCGHEVRIRLCRRQSWCLGDEVLTPDSSRFWPRDTYQPGRAQNSYDKQYVRDYLETIHWNKQPPAPALPPEVAQKTGEKYREAYRLLTGKDL